MADLAGGLPGNSVSVQRLRDSGFPADSPHGAEVCPGKQFGEWYRSDDAFEPKINDLLVRIKNEILKNEASDGIALIQCHLFEEGQCPKFTAENVTIPRERKRKMKSAILVAIWILFSICTFILCIVPCFNEVTTVLCSFLTIIAGIISVISFRRELFGAK